MWIDPRGTLLLLLSVDEKGRGEGGERARGKEDREERTIVEKRVRIKESKGDREEWKKRPVLCHGHWSLFPEQICLPL